MKTVTLIFILLLFAQCAHPTIKIDGSNAIHITVGSENFQEQILFSQLFDSIEHIVLENSDDWIIGTIDNIYYYNNRFFILDGMQHILFAFARDGTLLWKINRRGQGPGEYHSILNFAVYQDNLYLLVAPWRLLKFDLNGNFMADFQINAFGSSFMMSAERLYLYTCNQTSVYGNHTLLILDERGQNFKGGAIPIQGRLMNQCVTFNESRAFFRYNNEIRFFTPFSTNIYSISGGEVSIKYNLDFGRRNMPVDFFRRNTIDDLRETSFAHGLNSFWENDLFFSFRIFLDRSPWHMLYSKKENRLIYGRFSDDITFCFPNIQFANNDFAVGFRTMDALHREYSHTRESRAGTVLEEIVRNSDEYDNPVLFILNFRR